MLDLELGSDNHQTLEKALNPFQLDIGDCIAGAFVPQVPAVSAKGVIQASTLPLLMRDIC
ncbi:MAG: hypothetical protein JO227_07895 [Acetobacteraceae bacterium]|nr:hypothetical protein [Acetobacteraceae bacterium]